MVTIRDQTMMHKQPDLTAVNKKARTARFTDAAVLVDKVQHAIKKKLRMYHSLATEVKELLLLEKTRIVPSSAVMNGFITKLTLKILKTPEMEKKPPHSLKMLGSF